MKRGLLFSAITLLVGCTGIGELDQQSVVGVGTKSDLPEVICAGMSEGDQRTYVENDTDILWQSGDAISYFALGDRVKYEYSGTDGVASAEFNLVAQEEASRVIFTQAVYPYDANATCTHINGEDILSVCYPAEQNYATRSFGRGANLMVAAGKTPHTAEENLYFRNACGYFVIKLYGSGVKIQSVRLTALGGEKISGAATIVATHNAAPRITMADNAGSSVTLNCGTEGVAIATDAAHATEFWFALPPTTFEEGIKIEVTDTKGCVISKSTSKRIVVERNKVQPMAAIEVFVPNDNQIWYTRHSSSLQPLTLLQGEGDPFNVKITAHYYDEANKRFVIEFNGPLTTINMNAFYHFTDKNDTDDLATITLPKTLTSIGWFAFYHSGLSEITISGNVTHIGRSAFADCWKLKSITFEPSPTNTPLVIEPHHDNYSAGDCSPFFCCPLSRININRSINYLKTDGSVFKPKSSNDGLFYIDTAYYIYIDDHLEVEIGEQLTEIYDYMFSHTYIKEFTVPSHITKIGMGAFAHCSALNSITISNSVDVIGASAFYECTDLKSVNIESGDKSLSLGCSYTSVLGAEHGPFYDSPLEKIFLGRDINYINDEYKLFTPSSWDEGVFAYKHYDDKNLVTSVSIGDKVTTISNYMFSGVRLRSIYLYPAIKSIGYCAFWDCRIFQGLSCHHTVPPTLGDSAFEDCKEMWYIRVPEEAISAFKSADNWEDYDRNNKYNENFYYKQ